MTRWDAFADVCGYLRAGLLGGKPPRRRRNREWVLLIETSSFHFVTPSLAGCLKDELGLPHEIREYLNVVLTFNGRRNALLLETLSRIVAALNAIDIEPVLMKGCARLVQREYPQPNMRFLGDLDVLVPTNRATDAYAALVANGFYEKPGQAYRPDHHHLHMLIDNNTGAGVEIHREVSPGFCPQVLLTSWFCEGSRPFRLQDNLHVRLPDQTRSAGYNIVHNQFHHDGYQNCTIELRQLLDLALIRKRHEAAIDWAELDYFFCRDGLGEVLATYLQFCEELLGQQAPRLRCRPRVRAIKRFRRIVDPPKPSKFAQTATALASKLAPIATTPASKLASIAAALTGKLTSIATALASIVKDYVAARRQDPLGLLKLLNPMKWPRRLKLLKDAFQAYDRNKQPNRAAPR